MSGMVTEFAHIEAKPGIEQELIKGVEASRPVFMAAKGCKHMALQRSVEEPTKFLLIVQWESVEDHMVHFRESEGFKVWRGNVGHCFAVPPVVWHGEAVA